MLNHCHNPYGTIRLKYTCSTHLFAFLSDFATVEAARGEGVLNKVLLSIEHLMPSAAKGDESSCDMPTSAGFFRRGGLPSISISIKNKYKGVT